MKKKLIKKSVLTFASLCILILVFIYATVAWYTMIANETGITADVAEFDFKVNEVEEDFIIDVNDYINIKEGVHGGLAAPGTKGVIPVKLSTTDSSIGASYAINFDFSAMAPEFKERIEFYYFTKEGENYIKHVITETSEDIKGTIDAAGQGNTNSVMEYIYWEWKYTADITPILVAYVNGSWTNYENMEEMTYDQIKAAVDYWQNGYDSTKYDELKASGNLEVMDPEKDEFEQLDGLSGWKLKDKIQELYLDEHDAFDTAVSTGLYDEKLVSSNGKTYNKETRKVKVGNATQEITFKAYQVAMEVKMVVVGAQAVPISGNEGNAATSGVGMTVLNPDEK